MAFYRLVRPLLFKMDAESAHHLGIRAARLGNALGSSLISSALSVVDPALEQQVFGLSFRNPVGLAAGFDKNGTLRSFWPRLGFGFVEIGSVTARASEGNPRPRAFRLPSDEAIINRMGLNNEGATRVSQRILDGQESVVPLGINIAKTHDPEILGKDAIADFKESFRILAPIADYVTLNVSCPNTREGKTFEDPEALRELLAAIFDARSDQELDVPVLVKLSPPAATAREATDMHRVYDAILDVCDAFPVAGFIATNTASDRSGLTASENTLTKIGSGGLSGRPIASRSTSLIRFLYNSLSGTRPIIGVGGIDSATAAYEKIRAGASLIQLYTGLVYQGPGLIKRINKGIIALLKRDGYSSISEAVGQDAA